ncbi:MAG: hypothetical protein HY320_00250 [Armatimonadetes bacterium]|nr:hypothetical protein [Armatimonadota bacterium]
MDVWVVVAAGGGRPDIVAVSYAVPVSNNQVREDYRALARSLNRAVVTPKIQRRRDLPGESVSVGAEANLTGLVNWQIGRLNLDALLETFKRYRHTAVSFFLWAPFQLKWPTGGETRGPVRWQLTSRNPFSVTYHIWIDQSRGIPQTLPSLQPSGIGWGPVIGIGLIALIAGMGIFWIAHTVLRQRHAIPPASEDPECGSISKS